MADRDVTAKPLETYSANANNLYVPNLPSIGPNPGDPCVCQQWPRTLTLNWGNQWTITWKKYRDHKPLHGEQVIVALAALDRNGFPIVVVARYEHDAAYDQGVWDIGAPWGRVAVNPDDEWDILPRPPGLPVSPWKKYRRTGVSEMRPYVPGEDLTGISVSPPDAEMLAQAARDGRNPGGYVARNPDNHEDQWYVAQAYADKNLEALDE